MTYDPEADVGSTSVWGWFSPSKYWAKFSTFALQACGLGAGQTVASSSKKSLLYMHVGWSLVPIVLLGVLEFALHACGLGASCRD